jgi:hypothetical protein
MPCRRRTGRELSSEFSTRHGWSSVPTEGINRHHDMPIDPLAYEIRAGSGCYFTTKALERPLYGKSLESMLLTAT